MTVEVIDTAVTNATITPLAAALSYAARAWHVFPVPPNSKKSYKSAEHSNGAKWGMTNDPEAIRADYARWPAAGVGIPCGKVNGFWVVEADTQAGHAVDGIASLSALEAEHGPLPQTRMAQSPSGSLHYYFKHPGGDVKVKNSSSQLAPGVDVRGDGGMVVAPPTQRADGQYRWLNDLPIADPPQWLLTLVTQRPREERVCAAEGTHQQVNLALIAVAVGAIPNNDLDWENWNKVGMAIWRGTGGSEEGYAIFDGFSQKSDKYAATETLARWNGFFTCPPDRIGVGSLFRLADEAAPGWRGVTVDNFYAYMPLHKYMFAPARDLWPASSVNARMPAMPLLHENGQPKTDAKGNEIYLSASTWLDQNKPVEQMTWAPGLPMLVQDRLISEGGWITRYGVACFNLYRPPTIMLGDPKKAEPWLRHVIKVYGKIDGRHIVKWLAHRMQRPEDKINHALVLGGGQGIGKDTLLEPVKRAVGPWNFIEVSPKQMMGRFNGFLKSVILRVSEARDLGEFDRFAFYDHLKVYTSAPPDVLRVDEKNLREHYVLNVCGIIITTNHKADGIYLPADDRRHYVAWSDRDKKEFAAAYWPKLWQWYDAGGDRNVAAYLATVDLADFDPKAPPPKTAAFWAIVDASRAPEEGELADALETLGSPAAVLLSQIAGAASDSFAHWLRERGNRRIIPHRLEKAGYVPVRNPDRDDGLWKVSGLRQVIYAKASLALAAQLQAARTLQRDPPF